MLNPSRLARLVEQGQFDRLLDCVLRNGRHASEPVRRRLSDPRALRAAALGLALQRACELAYAPVDEVMNLLDAVRAEQRPEGFFGADADAASTSACTAGIEAFLQLVGEDHPAARQARAAASAAVVWLVSTSATTGRDADIVRWALGARVPALVAGVAGVSGGTGRVANVSGHRADERAAA